MYLYLHLLIHECKSLLPKLEHQFKTIWWFSIAEFLCTIHLFFSANFFILANVCFFGVGILLGCTSLFFRKEGRIQVLEGPAPVKSLLRTLQVGKAGWKNHWISYQGYLIWQFFQQQKRCLQILLFWFYYNKMTCFI